MVFNSVLMMSVANISANLWQNVAFNPERLSSQEVLNLVCCLPLQQLGRLVVCLWNFFCFPPPASFYYTYTSDASDSSSSDYDPYDSHSD